MYSSSVNGHEAFILVRSPYKTSARRKMKYVSDGNGMLNWQEAKLPGEEAKKLLAKYEVDSLYLSEEQFANA